MPKLKGNDIIASIRKNDKENIIIRPVEFDKKIWVDLVICRSDFGKDWVKLKHILTVNPKTLSELIKGLQKAMVLFSQEREEG